MTIKLGYVTGIIYGEKTLFGDGGNITVSEVPYQ